MVAWFSINKTSYSALLSKKAISEFPIFLISMKRLVQLYNVEVEQIVWGSVEKSVSLR